MSAADAGARILLTLWVGGVWVVGFVAVPLLFDRLGDRVLAGDLAGILFAVVHAIGGLYGVVAVLQGWLGGRFPSRVRDGLVLAALLLIGVEQLVLAPQIAELRHQSPPATGTEAFARLHGMASTLYLIEALIGLGLVVLPDREVNGSRS